MTRIIAGAARGFRLVTPRGDRTRPTSDRVREALFSSLAAWAGTGDRPPEAQMDGVAFLDLYTGSGAIGLEAVSRGAARVVLVESHPPTARLVARNAETVAPARVRPPQIEVVTRDIAAYLAQPAPVRTLFDVVWLDPPYALPTADLEAALRGVVDGWLADDGLVVVERSARSEPFAWPEPLETRWHKAYGETVLHYARPAA